MKFVAENQAKIYLAIVAKIEAKLAEIDNGKTMLFEFEPYEGGGVILNMYPPHDELLPDGVGSGGSILLEDCFERDGPSRFLVTLESSEGDPDVFWIIPSATNFDEKIDEVVAKAVPRMLN